LLRALLLLLRGKRRRRSLLELRSLLRLKLLLRGRLKLRGLLRLKLLLWQLGWLSLLRERRLKLLLLLLLLLWQLGRRLSLKLRRQERLLLLGWLSLLRERRLKLLLLWQLGRKRRRLGLKLRRLERLLLLRERRLKLLLLLLRQLLWHRSLELSLLGERLLKLLRGQLATRLLKRCMCLWVARVMRRLAAVMGMGTTVRRHQMRRQRRCAAAHIGRPSRGACTRHARIRRLTRRRNWVIVVIVCGWLLGFEFLHHREEYTNNNQTRHTKRRVLEPALFVRWGRTGCRGSLGGSCLLCGSWLWRQLHLLKGRIRGRCMLLRHIKLRRLLHRHRRRRSVKYRDICARGHRRPLEGSVE